MGGRGMGKQYKPRHDPKKCGISLALDGSENHLLNIEKLPEYAMPEEVSEIKEYELLSDNEDEGEGNDNDEFDIMEELQYKYDISFCVFQDNIVLLLELFCLFVFVLDINALSNIMPQVIIPPEYKPPKYSL